MAVQEGSGPLPQPATLRLGELIEPRPVLVDSHRAGRLWLSCGLRILHAIHISFFWGTVNVARVRLGLHCLSRG